MMTKRLIFQLDSNLDGQYPIPHIQLQNISHLNSLEYFALQGGYRENDNYMMFSVDTFKNLTRMRELHINIVTSNCDIAKITKHLDSLEVLDLTNTRHLNKSCVKGILGSFPSTNLKTLSLRSFQMPGILGYSDTLNISLYFNQTMATENLDLSRNMFGVIYPSIITIFPKLTSLDISENYLLSVNNDALLIELMGHPVLQELNMENQGVGYTTDNSSDTRVSYYSKHRKVHVQKTQIPKHMIEYITKCINANDGGNITLLFTNTSVFCATVRCVGLPAQHLFEGVPCEAYGNFSDNFDSSCPFYIRIPAARSLKSVKASHMNWISRITPKWSFDFCIQQSPLQYISFGDNQNWMHNSFLYGFWQQVTFNSSFPELKKLNLSKTNLESIPKGSLLNLQELYLSGNNIKINESLCGQFPNLKYLSIADNKLMSVLYDFIWTCQYLEHLDLSENFLNLSRYPIRMSPLLRTIKLSNNKIDILPSNFTRQLEQIIRHQKEYNMTGKITLEMNNNKFLCTCTHEAIEFIDWFQSTEVIITDQEQITCSSSQGELFMNDIDTEQFKALCFPSNIKVIVISIIVTICVVLLLVSIVVVYRYRWRIQFSMMKCCKGTCHRKTKSISGINNDTIPMKYDAFVSYCSDDRFWVHDCLMRTLESDLYGFKLCIHYRDFPLGEDISTVIVNSIRQSRQLIIVLSKCSITRPWCQLEFQVALSDAVRRGIKLVVIKLGSFTVDDTIDSSLAWVLDNHTYLEWKENTNAQKVFWYKLRRHLSGYVSGCCQLGSVEIDHEAISAFAECESEEIATFAECENELHPLTK